MRGICKRFGDVQANDQVDLRVARGHIHGIVGENGAGKSTLMSILYGFYQADSGEIVVEGRPARIRNSHEAIALGIGMVHQHFMLVETFSALDNVLLGAEPGWRLKPARGKVREELAGLRSAKFSGGNQQKLVLAREAFHQPKVLLVGQPTRGVDIGAIEFIHARLRAMRDAGGAVLVVSSELDEILALADRVLVMAGGRVAGELPIEQCSEAALGRLMAGVSA